MKMIFLILLLIPLLSFANGNGEDRPWQFDNPNSKMLSLNEAIARQKAKNGGFNQIYNINADGAASIYVGNNTNYDEVDTINSTSSTAIGNVVDIDGNDNSVDSTQDATDSTQTAVGSQLTDFDDAVSVGADLDDIIAPSDIESKQHYSHGEH